MKRILIALAVVVFGMSALQQARGADVSVDYFYDNLSGGNWIDVEGYGYGWQPDVAVNDSTWRPYADGYWAYTDDGWTWISYEDFGWATYHYGRWANLSDYGWIWFPGEDLDWGPAWVSWRTGGDYVGWAPLPPRGPGIVYEGGPIGPQVDIQFDIGPQYYNFCEARYIGEPVLRNYIAPPVQNVTYINNTVNVTNITVQNNVVYNYGPNYETLSARSARPIQRLNIERQSAANFSAAAKSGAVTKVQGNKLLVAAPQKLAKAPPAARPAAVKTKVAQPKLNRGWAGVPDETQLKQKIKTENPKNVPPPTGAGAGKPAPAIGGAPAVPGGKGKPGRVPPAARSTPPGTMATPAGALASPFERGKRQGEPGKQQPKPAPTAGSTEGREKVPAQSLRPSPPTGERAKPESRFGPASARPGPANTPDAGRDKIERAPNKPATPPAGQGPRDRQSGPDRGQPGVPPAAAQRGEGQGAKERGQPGLNRPPSTPAAGPRTAEPRGGKGKGQGASGQQPGGQPKAGAPAPAERNPGQPERGKKKGEGTPPPRPY